MHRCSLNSWLTWYHTFADFSLFHTSSNSGEGYLGSFWSFKETCQVIAWSCTFCSQIICRVLSKILKTTWVHKIFRELQLRSHSSFPLFMWVHHQPKVGSWFEEFQRHHIHTIVTTLATIENLTFHGISGGITGQQCIWNLTATWFDLKWAWISLSWCCWSYKEKRNITNFPVPNSQWISYGREII